MAPGETLETLLNGSIFQFMMVFARLGSGVSLLPGFGEAYVPVRVRLAFALLFSLALMPMLADRVPVLPADLDRFVMDLVGEIGIGLFFGSLCRIILMAVLSAGNIIALQTGIANALSVDPSTSQQAAVSGNFLMAVTLVLIFSTGLDHITIQALVGTYAVMPPGQLPPMGDIANFDARAVADSFTLALQMSAPFLVYGLVFTAAMGVLARLMPTLQIFFVATPAQLLFGLALLAITLSSLMIWFLDTYQRQLAPFLNQSVEMADSDNSQKTEDPTGRRLQEAHDSGQVANSREVNNLFMILALTISVVAFGGGLAREIVNMSLPFIEAPDKVPTDIGHLTTLGWKLMGMIMIAGAAPLALALIAAFGAGYLQFGLILSSESLMPSLDKISPLAGLKRIFSSRSLSEFVKGLLKLAIVGSIVFWILMPSIGDLHKLIGMEAVQLLAIIRELTNHLLIAVLTALVAITLADVLYQRYEHMKQLRMSRQELKDEARESEGDPLVKGRLRQLRMERARKRMMAEVPKADVVVTNPTHYAVALRYDQSEMQAPKVTAKGMDALALKIREIAAEAGVPVVENPPLARGLYASVEIDQEVPAEFYKAVAEVIGYIYKLKRKRL